MKRFTISMSDSLVEFLEERMKETGASKSSLIALAVEQYKEDYLEKFKKSNMKKEEK